MSGEKVEIGLSSRHVRSSAKNEVERAKCHIFPWVNRRLKKNKK